MNHRLFLDTKTTKICEPNSWKLNSKYILVKKSFKLFPKNYSIVTITS